MTKDEQDFIINKIVNDLYDWKKITDEMKNVSLKFVYEDTCLNNLFENRNVVNEYYFCTNSEKEQGIISVLRYTGYNTSKKEPIIKVLLPFCKRTLEIGNYKSTDVTELTVLTHNKGTNKYGIISLNNSELKFLLDEKYDEIKSDDTGYIVRIDNRVGRVCVDKKHYNIPIKYDDIKEQKHACFSKFGELVEQVSFPQGNALVKSGNLWGAYCYTEDYHFRSLKRDPDITFDQKYIKKRFVPPLFEKIEPFYYDYDEKNIYLKVLLNGKIGILDVYNRNFVAPIVFDKITHFEKTKIAESYDDKFVFYGYINGSYYQYDGKSFFKKDEEVFLSEPYQNVKEKIKKYNVRNNNNLQ